MTNAEKKLINIFLEDSNYCADDKVISDNKDKVLMIINNDGTVLDFENMVAVEKYFGTYFSFNQSKQIANVMNDKNLWDL